METHPMNAIRISRDFCRRGKISRFLTVSSMIPKTDNAPLFILIPLSLGLNCFWLWWGLPNGANIWAVDGIAPIEPLIAAKRMIIDDWWNSRYVNKYPMGHFFVLLTVYTPYMLYLIATGGLNKPTDAYPYGLENPETALTVLTLIANGVSTLMGVGIVVLIYMTARDFFGRRGAFFSALTVAFSPPFIYYSHTSNVDIPSLFWCTVGLFAFARLVQGNIERYNYVLLGLAAGMAMATKEQALGLFILLPFPILILHLMHQRDTGHHRSRFTTRQASRALFDPRILWGLGACILTFVLATHLIFNWDANYWRIVWRIYKFHPELGQKYASPPLEVSGIFDAWQQTFWLLWDSMNPFLFIASVLGILYFPFKERWAAYFLAPFLSYFLIAIPMLTFLRARFVMGLVLVLGFFSGRFLNGIWLWGLRGSKGRSLLLVGFGLLWTYSLLYGFSVDYLMMYDARYKAEAWIRDNLAISATVETYTEATYLPRLPPHLTVHRSSFSQEALLGLPERSPDYLVLTGAQHNRFKEGSIQKLLLIRLLQGDFGYQPLQTFQTQSFLAPNLIPGLSPEIIILTRRNQQNAH